MSERPTFHAAARLFAHISKDDGDDHDMNAPPPSDQSAVHETNAGKPADHPRQIGPFIIEQEIGSGGSGVVYKAYRSGSERPVALKLIDSRLGDSDHSRRARRELELIEQLHLHCLPRLIDYGEHQGRLYIATEFVDGDDLVTYCKSRELDRRRRVELLAAVADAVHSVHEKGVLHRDLKPSNIIITAAGEPMIIDLGIATLRSRSALDHHTLTTTGTPLGTPAYMAPEQARGDREAISTRTDIACLGATAFHVLTGQPPHGPDASLHELLVDVATKPPRDPREIDPAMPKPLAGILRKAVAKEPKERYESAAAFAADLRRWLRGEPVQASKQGPREAVRYFVRSHPMLALMTACVLLGIGAGGAMGIRMLLPEPPITSINLSDSAHLLPLQFTGDYPDSRMGESLAVGDFDGDGQVDFAVGAPARPAMSTQPWATHAGAVFLDLSSRRSQDQRPETTDTVHADFDLCIEGTIAHGQLGFRIINAGDVNGDGIDDLAVAAPGSTSTPESPTGDVHLFFGSRGWTQSPTTPVADLAADSHAVIRGLHPGDQFGAALAALGDIDGDGFDDFAIGACEDSTTAERAGSAVIVHGRRDWHSASNASSIVDIDRVILLASDEPEYRFGCSIALLDPTFLDGIPTIAVGALGSDPLGRRAGSVALYDIDDIAERGFGFDVIEQNEALAVFCGDEADEWFGTQVCNAGDVDGDGNHDLLVGAEQIARAAGDGGEAHLIFGGQNWNGPQPIEALHEQQHATAFVAPPARLGTGDLLGRHLAAAGDVNGDGFADLLIGAPRTNVNNFDSGAVYLIFGGPDLRKTSHWSLTPDGTSAGVVLYGAQNGDQAAHCAAVGDLNNDGYDDIFVGCTGSDPEGIINAGRACIIAGFPRQRRVEVHSSPP